MKLKKKYNKKLANGGEVDKPEVYGSTDRNSYGDMGVSIGGKDGKPSVGIGTYKDLIENGKLYPYIFGSKDFGKTNITLSTTPNKDAVKYFPTIEAERDLGRGWKANVYADFPSREYRAGITKEFPYGGTINSVPKLAGGMDFTDYFNGGDSKGAGNAGAAISSGLGMASGLIDSFSTKGDGTKSTAGVIGSDMTKYTGMGASFGGPWGAVAGAGVGAIMSGVDVLQNNKMKKEVAARKAEEDKLHNQMVFNTDKANLNNFNQTGNQVNSLMANGGDLDSTMNSTNEDYFKQRVSEIGITEATKEYNDFFNKKEVKKKFSINDYTK